MTAYKHREEIDQRMKDLSREYSKTPTGDPLRSEIESKLSALYQQRCIASFAVALEPLDRTLRNRCQ